MATVNFISYKTQSASTLKGAIAYVNQKNKTGVNRENLELKHQVRNTNNQNQIQLTSGINCTPETAFDEFSSTKASYNKSDGVQFYHYVQSFKDDENISPKTAHEIAMKFAEENYKSYEVLVATHVDNDHLHSHIIINSVSFDTGKKLHQPPNTLQKLRFSSDTICKQHGLKTLDTYTYGRSKTMGRAESRARERGTSWKFELCLMIEKTMKKAKDKEDFNKKLEEQGCKAKWKDDKNTIIYTDTHGHFCGCDKLYGKKYLLENMLKEFEIRKNNDFSTDIKTGWEYERKDYVHSLSKPIEKTKLTLTVGKQILYGINNILKDDNQDDDLNDLVDVAALTMMSFAGVYLLTQMLVTREDDLNLEDLENIIEEIKLEPENCAGFEDEQEVQGFEMTMGGY
ncbi:MAG: relaxase/mobilization nuclease domain-containing protein [Clostridia bacterium]